MRPCCRSNEDRIREGDPEEVPHRDGFATSWLGVLTYMTIHRLGHTQLQSRAEGGDDFHSLNALMMDF